ARMELREGQLSLLVDDTAAVYPVVIDPLIFAETKLTASDKAADDNFGWSVAVSGDTVVVGAPHHDGAVTGAHVGAAYLFERSGTTWTQQVELAASDQARGDLCRWSGASHHDAAVTGANVGAAYLFERSGTPWTQQAELAASDQAAGDLFGWSVAINGDTVVVGAIGSHFEPVAGMGPGAAYVFVRSSGVWSQQAELTASDKAVSDEFGYP